MIKILVVDDNHTPREVICEALKQFNIQVKEAVNGVEATKILEAEQFNLVITDVVMPEMNGYEFVCEVRKDDRYKDMKLMMVTTETEMAQVIKALEAGANEYVMKPFTKDMIVEKLTLMGIDVG